MNTHHTDYAEQGTGSVLLQQHHFLNLLRIIGCILVVGVHVSAFNLEDLPFPSTAIFITSAFNHLSILGVPLFVMISGSLLLHPDYPLSFRKLLTHKIPKLLLVYFVWLVFYNLLNCYQEGYGYGFASIKHNVILNSLLGRGIYHLWFLPMMIGLYFITPFLRKLVTDRKLCGYFLLLYFLVTIFFPTLLKFNFRFKTIVESLCSRIPYSIFGGYIGYYVLGYYLRNYIPKLTTGRKLSAAMAGILSMLGGIVISYRRALGFGVFSQILNDPFSLNDFIAACAIYLLVRETNSYALSHPAYDRVTKYLASLSMGIYLLHPAILMFMSWFSMDTLFAPPYLSIPVGIAAVTLLAGFVTALFKQIPGIRKLLI